MQIWLLWLMGKSYHSSLLHSFILKLFFKVTFDRNYLLTIIQSRFRKEVSTRKVKSSSNFVGMLLQDCPLPTPSHGHVVLCDPAPVLFYQVRIKFDFIFI